MNNNAKVVIKTYTGITDRISINNTIMQGSLICTSTSDTLGKQCYEEPEKLYQYKGIPIPPFGMVDDIISVTNVEQTKNTNGTINTFIESKKLKFSKNKCYQIHIGKGHKGCPTLKVHDELSQK